MDTWTVSALYIYPVKSCQPVQLTQSLLTPTGLQYDRLWMLSDVRSNRFVTQRQVPALSQIKVAIGSSELVLTAKKMPQPLVLPLNLAREDLGAELIRVRVWFDDVYGRCCGERAREWLSEFVGRPTRLLYQAQEEAPRMVTRYLPDAMQVQPRTGYADVHPLHLITEPSLQDVSQRAPRPLAHANFRPNLVLASADGRPYEEDSWKQLEVRSSEGSWRMHVVSRTPRCTIPNIDPGTGAVCGDGEPLRTLKTYRCVDPAKPAYACFGMQAVPDQSSAVLRLHQPVQVISRGSHSF